MKTLGPLDAEPLAGAAEPPRSAYVHIPFCAHKCGYCDFASVAGQDHLADRYLDALDLEMASVLDSPAPVRTIFVGGGTPTHLSGPQLDRALARIANRLPRADDCEFTVESNPNTLTRDKVDALRAHGVNRVSLGAQSFHPHLLRRLERTHEPRSVGQAVDLLRPRIENVSLDLIFGIPGQSLEEWRRDLDEALALEPTHLSAYALTYEKGTPLWKNRRLGVVRPVDEEIEARMYEHLLERMESAGFEQYEISNFARAGGVDFRCRHNWTYWSNEPYYGFGTGAAAYLGGVRTLNWKPLPGYLERVERGVSPVAQSERLEAPARARETAVLMLRRACGLDREDFLRRTGFSFDEIGGRAFEEAASLGLSADDGRRVRLTRAGLLLADAILARIV